MIQKQRVGVKYFTASRLMVVAMLLVIESCSTFTVTSKQTPNADDIFTTTKIAWAWGISDVKLQEDCSGNGLQFVAMETNWLYSLCSVATLGIIVPMEIQYRCAGVPAHDGGTIH